MKSLKYIITSLFIVLLTFSCTEDFEEINQNPNDPTSVPAELLMTDVLFQAGNRLYSTFVGGDMGSCWSQQWAKVQYNDEERYSPRQSVITTFWDVFYEDVLADAITMTQLARDEGNPALEGVGLTLQAYALSILTDMFGSVPAGEAGRAGEGIFTPAYDEQSVVYDTIFARLDRAALLMTQGGSISDGSFDLLYSGDITKWRKFANSLKVRSLMRISETSSFSASDLEAAIANGIFTSVDDEAKMDYLEASPSANPIFETIIFGNRGEFKVSDVLVGTMEGFGDPRLSVYAEVNDAGEFRGKPAGIRDVPSDDYNYNNVSGIGEYYTSATAPAHFLSFAELQFLLAEAAKKGYISGGDATAQTYYEAGITAAIESHNGFVKEDGSVIAISADTYVTNTGVAYSAADALEQIATQNWLALYCQGVESWTEWRRTGYPVLTPAIDANPTVGEIPSRWQYPASEQTTNNVSYQAAVSTQGADVLTTKVWWMN